MIKVSKEEFYDVICGLNLDALVTSYEKEAEWTLRGDRKVIGKTSGYKFPEEENQFYLIDEELFRRRNKA